jgi:gluconolactonase
MVLDLLRRLITTGAITATAVLSMAPAEAGSASAVAGLDPIFEDDFESGDACGWSARPPLLTEDFGDLDASSWPTIFTVVGGLTTADIQGGRGRLTAEPSPFEPGRIVAPVANRDVDVRFSFALEDVTRQGVGFYVRQNGGYLTHTTPTGEGYGLFLEGFIGSRIGLWREEDGIEQPLVRIPPPLTFEDGSLYRARLRVTQLTPTETLLQGKVWLAVDSEPPEWHVSTIDDLPSLQNLSGGIAADAYTTSGAGSPSAFFDDLVVEELCNPLRNRGPVETLADTFIFTEGPEWRGDHLLFSELASPGNPGATAIWRFESPSSFDLERSPSDFANGLATGLGGELLAAEHATRRLSITDDLGIVTTLVDNYQGNAFNSPNDLAVRADGTVYFTDPSYGMAAHGQPREIAFNGLYRRAPNGDVTAEWEGAEGNNEPNGVALSPDQQTLYATDTAVGALLAFDIAVGGELSNQRTLVFGLDTPDGLCVDRRGNLFVATWGQAVEVFAPDGTVWGSIPLARDATNCAFGGFDGRTLFITALDQLYAVELSAPGLP